jgi:hypothetical protein
MVNDSFESSIAKIETTIGELVETITQIALETGKSEQEGYELASLAIENILRRNSRTEAA